MCCANTHIGLTILLKFSEQQIKSTKPIYILFPLLDSVPTSLPNRMNLTPNRNNSVPNTAPPSHLQRTLVKRISVTDRQTCNLK